MKKTSGFLGSQEFDEFEKQAQRQFRKTIWRSLRHWARNTAQALKDLLRA